MKFRDHNPLPKQNLLLYGDSKVGKTTGACSAPGPVLLINADLPHAPWYARTVHPEVQELAWGEGYSGNSPGLAMLLDVEQKAYDGTLGFETVILDPVGEAYLRLLGELSNDAISPSLPTYGAVGTYLFRWCKAMCECENVNLVLVAHEMTADAPDEDPPVKLRPFTGTNKTRLGDRLTALVDVYGYVALTDDGPMVQLVNGKGRVGGDRTNSLGRTRALDLTEWYNTMAVAMAATTPGAKPEKEGK